ncbi:hypothetical protein C8Q76DRAFT_800349 [Earliella scabrosa]|nr:hypothetical protein C8Q76DRAFT_800349 [Earliella scabrosa]
MPSSISDGNGAPLQRVPCRDASPPAEAGLTLPWSWILFIVIVSYGLSLVWSLAASIVYTVIGGAILHYPSIFVRAKQDPWGTDKHIVANAFSKVAAAGSALCSLAIWIGIGMVAVGTVLVLQVWRRTRAEAGRELWDPVFGWALTLKGAGVVGMISGVFALSTGLVVRPSHGGLEGYDALRALKAGGLGAAIVGPVGLAGSAALWVCLGK